MKLKKLFNTQIAYAWTEFILSIVIIIGMVVRAMNTTQATDYWGHLDNYITNEGPYYAGVAISAVAGVAALVIWVLGIVNACKIHAATQNSAILIVFSVITLLFGHLIVVYSQRNKFEAYFYEHKETKAEVKTEEVIKPVAKKAAPKKVVTKKTTVKKVAAKKPVAKKAVAKKATTKKPVAKKHLQRKQVKGNL